MYQKPAAPSSIVAVVEDAFRLYRAAFNRAWVPALMMQMLVTGALVYVQSDNPQLKSGPMAWDKVSPASLVPYIGALIASLLFFNAVTLQLLAVRRREDLSIGASLAAGARSFLPMLGLSMFVGAGMMLGIALVGSLAAALPGGVKQGAGLFAIGAAAYLLVRVSLAFVPLLGERTSVAEAVRASWTVTRGQGWRLVAVMLAVLVLFAVGLLVLSLGASFVTFIVRIDTFAGLLALQLVAAVIQAATVPFVYAGFVASYNDLQLRGAGG